MCIQNYQDFYQKALIPIGSNDKMALDIESSEDLNSTHWLIALTGHLKESKQEYYLWKVVVYHTNHDGEFLWKNPHYSSESYDCFHKAYDAAKDIEECSRKDVLVSSKLQEKIS